MQGVTAGAELLRRYAVLLWDFDGVIKESVDLKTQAYVMLFGKSDPELARRIRKHAEAYGGMSRYEKVPLYLGWAGQSAGAREVARGCDAFSATVRQAVIDCPWVPGARDYLEANHARQRFVLLTATPQAEILDIVRLLGIDRYFREVHGAPRRKSDAIASVLARWGCGPGECLLIGDSEADLQAAAAAKVDFLLRRTGLNGHLQRAHIGLQCEDFRNG